MLAPVTSVDATTGGVKIQWSAPSSNGDAITSYVIEIANALSTSWYEDTTNCLGSSTTVMANLYCIVPMSTLRTGLYNNVFD